MSNSRLAVRSLSIAVAGLTCAVFLCLASPALAQAVAPNLNTLATYGVVSTTFSNTNVPPQTIVNGTLGQPVICYTIPPGAQPTSFIGTELTPCPPATTTDENSAIVTINGQACTSLGVAVSLDAAPGHPTGIYTPGCYSTSGAMSVGATVTLNGAGVYVFRSGGAINTLANSNVVMAGGACQNDVYWGAVGATTIGANATFVGSILDQAGVTIGNLATLTGRALSSATTVTTTADTINVPTCAFFSGGGGGGGGGGPTIPSISKAFAPATNGPGGVSTLTLTLINPNAGAATLTANLIDTLPAGVVTAPTPNAVTTCIGGIVGNAPGATTVQLAVGSIIPGASGGVPGSCTVVENVTASALGVYTNTIPVGGLQTTNGNSGVAAVAVLTILAIPPVPTLPQVFLLLLALGLAGAGYVSLRRRSPEQ